MSEAQALPADAAPPPAAKARSGIGMVLLAVLLSVGASAGVGWVLFSKVEASLGARGAPAEGEAAEGQSRRIPPPAHYLALEPAFIANLESERPSRFLQVQVDVMSRNAKELEKITAHAPQIRSRLLMLFAQQSPSALATREGREALQAQVLEDIRAVLVAETGTAEIEAVFFSSFVMQ
jgi:flagellar FliL protein